MLFCPLFADQTALAFLLVDRNCLLDPLDRLIKITRLCVSRSQGAENISLIKVGQFSCLSRQLDRPLPVTQIIIRRSRENPSQIIQHTFVGRDQTLFTFSFLDIKNLVGNLQSFVVILDRSFVISCRQASIGGASKSAQPLLQNQDLLISILSFDSGHRILLEQIFVDPNGSGRLVIRVVEIRQLPLIKLIRAIIVAKQLEILNRFGELPLLRVNDAT